MKRFLSLLAAAALLAALAACSGDGTTPPSVPSAPSAAGQEVPLSFLRIANDEGERTFWQEVIASFESDHPGVTVEYDDAAIGDDMDVKLTALFAANAGPDVIGHGILSVASRVVAGHYTPITDYFEAWEGKDDIFPQLVDLGRYNGEVYGIAYQPAPYVLAYRVDWFEDAGFSGPPQTWDELAEYARALTVRENGQIVRAGFAFPASAGNFVEYDTFAYGNGGGFVGEDGQPTLNTEANIQALQFAADLAGEVSLPYNANETNPFMTGNAAMTLIDNVKLTPMFALEEYEDKVGIALPPGNAGNPGMTFSGCRLLFIGKDCKYRDEAFSFISYAVSADVVEKRANDNNVPVVLASQVDAFAGKDPYNAVRADCVAHGIGMPITTWSSMFQRIRNDAVQQALAGGDPAAILNDAQEKLLQEIQDAE